MDVHDFYDKVEEHEELEGVSIKDDETVSFVVRYKPTGLKTEVELEAIENNDWDKILSVLRGEREPNILYHMTRVVGYYSRTDNWNQSKIGELKARHAGDYAVVAV